MKKAKLRFAEIVIRIGFKPMAFPLSGILYSAFINHIFWFFSRPIEFICSSNHYNEKGEATLRRDCDPDWIQTNGLPAERDTLFSFYQPYILVLFQTNRVYLQ